MLPPFWEPFAEHAKYTPLAFEKNYNSCITTPSYLLRKECVAINMKLKNNKALTAGFLVAATLLAKLCGMLRDIVIAGMYGTTTNEAAAFSTASRIPLLFFDIALGSAVTSAFIPIFNEFLEKDGRERAVRFSNSFINLVLLITVIMTAVGMIFSGEFVRLIAGGLSDAKIALASSLVKIMFPTIIFTGLAYCFVGILQSFGEFYVPAIISLVSNGLLILYLLIFRNRFGVHGVAIAMLAAWSTQFLVQIPALKKMKYSYKPVLDLRDDGIKKACALALPIIVSTWVQPINTMVNIRLASSMADGGAVSALDYANKLYIILVGVFTFAITNLIFPSLSRAVANGDDEHYSLTVRRAVRYVIFIITPVMAGFLLMSTPIIRLFYERGAFGADSTQLTATALFFYSLGMLGYGTSEICNKSFYALHDGKTPMRISMGGIALNVTLSLVFVLLGKQGHWALAFSASVAANIIGFSMLFVLNRRRKILNRSVGVFALKIAAATLVMAACAYGTKIALGSLADDKLLGLFVPASVGAAAYIICCVLLRVNELTDIISLALGRAKGGAK